MAVVIEDVTLLTWDTGEARNVDIGVGDDGKVAWVEKPGQGSFEETVKVEKVRGAGRLCTPALVVGHHHLYSALAPGMPPSPEVPTNFVEILEQIWWRLDRCFDLDLIRSSGAYGALAAARLGAGTVIDHHASPGCITGSLGSLAGGLGQVGLRSVLCYEVTDRGGHDQALEGVEENVQFLQSCQRREPLGGAPTQAGLLGGHASFTMDDATLDALGEHAQRGLHIHVCEGIADREISHEKFGAHPIQRLQERGLLGPRSLVAHGVHLSFEDYQALGECGATLVHNYRSNWNNSIGVPRADLAREAGVPVALGTDGMDGDMVAELKACLYANQAARLGQGWEVIGDYLTGNATLAARYLPGLQADRVSPGIPADLTLWDYPAAPCVLSGRGLGHLLFGMNGAQVCGTMVGGRWVYLEGEYPQVGDHAAVIADAREQMKKLWSRMEALE
jgi:cytosine/adenosine deaminase-related metal-dependent hydrolase